MSGIKRETIIRVILGICMIFVSIGMIYGKSKAGNANGNDRTYIEESEKNAKSGGVIARSRSFHRQHCPETPIRTNQLLLPRFPGGASNVAPVFSSCQTVTVKVFWQLEGFRDKREPIAQGYHITNHYQRRGEDVSFLRLAQ